jgi:hypothetical protein
VSVLGVAAEWTGGTIGFGARGSAGIGGTLKSGYPFGVAGGVSRQIVVSPSGRAAFVTSISSNSIPYNAALLGPTAGAGAIGGFQLSYSNASSPEQLGGGFGQVTGGFGAGGFGAGGDFAFSGDIYQGTLTLGAGTADFAGAGLIQDTSIQPFCE